MSILRMFIAGCLLVISTPSLALFMPAGFQIGSDASEVSGDSNDGGC